VLHKITSFRVKLQRRVLLVRTGNFSQTLVGILLTSCGIISAQAPPPGSLAPLEQAALKASADWLTLAKTLDSRVARLLPCDPRAKAAIEETLKASNTRTTALADYYRAAESQASSRTEGARRLLESEQNRSAAVAAAANHAQEALVTVESAIADLTESAKTQSALAAPRDALLQTQSMLKQRLQIAQDEAGLRTAVLDALKALTDAYQAREKAIKDAGAAFETERLRWNAYYAARAQRAQLECALTGGAASSTATAPAPAARTPAASKTQNKRKQ
jgi:hypothetical protein